MREYWVFERSVEGNPHRTPARYWSGTPEEFVSLAEAAVFRTRGKVYDALRKKYGKGAVRVADGWLVTVRGVEGGAERLIAREVADHLRSVGTLKFSLVPNVPLGILMDRFLDDDMVEEAEDLQELIKLGVV